MNTQFHQVFVSRKARSKCSRRGATESVVLKCDRPGKLSSRFGSTYSPICSGNSNEHRQRNPRAWQGQCWPALRRLFRVLIHPGLLVLCHYQGDRKIRSRLPNYSANLPRIFGKNYEQKSESRRRVQRSLSALRQKKPPDDFRGILFT